MLSLQCQVEGFYVTYSSLGMDISFLFVYIVTLTIKLYFLTLTEYIISYQKCKNASTVFLKTRSLYVYRFQFILSVDMVYDLPSSLKIPVIKH